MNNFYATLIVGRDGSLNYPNIRQSRGLAGSGMPPAKDWWLEDTNSCRFTISSTHWAWTQRQSLHKAVFLSIFPSSFFFSWEHCRWSVITPHSTEEGFIMGLVRWQDYCLDDKCSCWGLWKENQLYIFFFQSTKTCPDYTMLEGNRRTINTSSGWSSSVKAKWEFMKNKQITGNVNQEQWGNYKEWCAIPRAITKESSLESRSKIRPWRMKEWTNKPQVCPSKSFFRN